MYIRQILQTLLSGWILVQSQNVNFVKIGTTYSHQQYAAMVYTFDLQKVYQLFTKLHKEYIQLHNDVGKANTMYNRTWMDVEEFNDQNLSNFYKLQGMYNYMKTTINLVQNNLGIV